MRARTNFAATTGAIPGSGTNTDEVVSQVERGTR
jgi:hypothetical protein